MCLKPRLIGPRTSTMNICRHNKHVRRERVPLYKNLTSRYVEYSYGHFLVQSIVYTILKFGSADHHHHVVLAADGRRVNHGQNMAALIQEEGLDEHGQSCIVVPAGGLSENSNHANPPLFTMAQTRTRMETTRALILAANRFHLQSRASQTIRRDDPE
jgi:hypothetical protein